MQYMYLTMFLITDGDAQSQLTYVSGLSEDEVHEFIQLECQCGECAIDEFVAGKDCKQLARRSVPKLTIKTRDSDQDILPRQEMRFSDYKNSLREKDNEIRTKYTSLLLNTMRELKTNYYLEIAKQRVRSLLTPKDMLGSQYKRMYTTRGLNKRLKDVQTYEDLQQFLEQFCSWFNINFIADIRKALLSYESQDPLVVAYKENLERYLQRCCFQLTVCDLEGQTEHLIVCKTSTDFHEIKEEQINILETKLRQCVCIPISQRRIAECGKEMIFCLKEPLSLSNIEEPSEINPVYRHVTVLSLKSLIMVVFGSILLVLNGCLQGLAIAPAHQTKSLGSVRFGGNVTLPVTFSMGMLEFEKRLIFTKHPFSDISSISIHVKQCNGSQDKEITKCTISSSNHSCSIQWTALLSEVSVCIFASLHTNSSLPVIEYGVVYSYLLTRSYYIWGISLAFFCVSFSTMQMRLNALLVPVHLHKNIKHLFIILYTLLTLFIHGLICGLIIFNPWSIPL